MVNDKIIVRYKTYGPECYIVKENNGRFTCWWNGCRISFKQDTKVVAYNRMRSYIEKYIESEKIKLQSELNKINKIVLDKEEIGESWLDKYQIEVK